MRTIDEQILQDWIPSGQIETRFFNYENMIAFAKHYEKEKRRQKLRIHDVSKSKCQHLNVTNRVCNRCKQIITYVPDDR